MTFEEFAVAARSGGIVPVVVELPMEPDSPVAVMAKLRRGRFAFLLESAPAGSDSWARYTYVGTEPRRAWRVSDGTVEDWSPGDGWHGARRPDDPLADLDAILTTERPATAAGVAPFWSGAVGFLGYDMVRYIEECGPQPPRADDTPDALFVFTRTLVVLDNVERVTRIVVGVPVAAGLSANELRARYVGAMAEAEDVRERLAAPITIAPLAAGSEAATADSSSIGRTEFMELVDRLKEHIFAGDAFQVLLSRRMEFEAGFDGVDLYRALRAINPSPFMYHLVLDGLEIIGSSPELLVRLDDGNVTLRPIAGTRPRSPAKAEEDTRIAAELSNDPKERAEHVMLVDLGRNDVGRVAEYGTVRTTSFMQVEKYSHVFHLVSQVEGRVRAGLSAMDVIRATFPAGTMTGAPKVRAMQLINEVEPVRRGPYAGALGYIAAGGGRMELAITIRSCVLNKGRASVQAGAGIVADSIPEREWEETENKARAVLTAVGLARATRDSDAARSTRHAAI